MWCLVLAVKRIATANVPTQALTFPTVVLVELYAKAAKLVHQANVHVPTPSKIATVSVKISPTIVRIVGLVGRLVAQANFVPTASVWCRVLAAKPTATANVPTPTQTTNIVELVGQFARAARPVNLEYANAKAPVRIAAVSATT